MIEAGILLMMVAVLIGVEWVVWRFLRGPAHGRLGALRVLTLTGITLPLAFVSVWELSNSREFQVLGRMVTHVETSNPVVALSFDDGPQPGFTEEILQILREKKVRATFFVTGRDVEEHKPLAQQLVVEGHELGNHSYSHVRMVGRSYSFIRHEIERTDELIRAVGYAGEIHFRPPYSKRLIVLPYYLSVTGRITILMDVEPESYSEIATDSQRIVSHVLDKAKPGSIILLHVMNKSRAETMQAVPEIIEGLQAKGYSFVTISELLALDGR